MNIKSISTLAKKKNIVYYSLIPVFLLTVFAFAFSSISTSPSITSDSQVLGGMNYKGNVCVTQFRDGEIISTNCDHNVAMNIGLNKTRDILGLGASNPFNVIHLCNATAGAGCGTPAITDTAVQNTYVGCGLTAAAGTYANATGAGNWSIFKTFTSSCDARLTNVTYITDSSNVPLAGAYFGNLVTLQTNDQITVNWTLTIS